jgi:hypothetical protein
MGLIVDQTGTVVSIDQPERMQAGDPCVYLYRGPKGQSINPERFVARVIGFSITRRARLNAYDHVQKSWFRVTVEKHRLARINGAEYESLRQAESPAPHAGGSN